MLLEFNPTLIFTLIFTLISIVSTHVHIVQPSAGLKPSTIAKSLRTRVRVRSATLVLHLMITKMGPILPEATPHSIAVMRAFSSDSGADARWAS